MSIITAAILGMAVVFMGLALTSAAINVIGHRTKHALGDFENHFGKKNHNFNRMLPPSSR